MRFRQQALVATPSTNDSPNNLRTQPVDYVASFLLAGLIVFGLLVMLLLAIFLMPGHKSKGPSLIPTPVSSGTQNPHGYERDITPPGVEDCTELLDPTLAETIEAVTLAASTVAASPVATQSSDRSSAIGDGAGDDREFGDGGGDGIPEFQRWELKFKTAGLPEYRKQLDAFDIELACVGGSIATVDYAYAFADKPKTRSASPSQENKQQRIYFVWREGNAIQAFDEKLLIEAGVKTKRRQILKFIPKTLEKRLLELELQYAQEHDRELDEILKTVFESRAKSDGEYEFKVILQKYSIRS
ncbi:MAG: hypothetical protein AAF483_02095 [Planctomycetota bacterium]